MLDFSREAVQFTDGRSRADLDSDRILALAITHLIEIIGEAARLISKDMCSRHAEVPWDLIVSTRNRLSHGYIDVDLDIIWSIVTRDLPSLIVQLQDILKKAGE